MKWQVKSPRKYPASTGEVTGKSAPRYPASTPQVLAILSAASTSEKTREELQSAAGVKDREYFRKQHLRPLLDSGLLEATIPDKPRSSKQRYRITRLGIETLKRQSAGESKDK